MSWKEILKEDPVEINPPKRIEMVPIDREGIADVENNFDVDGWPKYVLFENRITHMHTIHALYKYVSSGKYKIIPYKNFQLLPNLETELDLDKDEAWSSFSDIRAKPQYVEERYKGMPVYNELDMGGALTVYRRKR
jgi:hypothetical protein|tara:strand:+ start:62 stop:469 length:408 start_codon:yes stop_codon:yes gene_type:complete